MPESSSSTDEVYRLSVYPRFAVCLVGYLWRLGLLQQYGIAIQHTTLKTSSYDISITKTMMQ
jgi:hypothetical protein